MLFILKDDQIVGHIEETGRGPYPPTRYVEYEEPIAASEPHTDRQDAISDRAPDERGADPG